MLDAAKLSAIAKIEMQRPQDDPALLGTGFVVGDGLVLTAKHVVSGRAGKLQLSFGKTGPRACEATVTWQGDGLDWAILTCEGARGIAPIALRRLGYGRSYWQTFSFFRQSGAYLQGQIYGLPPGSIDLRADEVGDNAGASVCGASGSPVIAHGAAIGVVTTERIDLTTKRVVNGELGALPIEAIVEDLKTRAPAAPVALSVDSLPYERLFVSSLRALRETLGELAIELGIPPQDDPAPDVARALLRLGWRGLRRHLIEIDTPDMQRLIDLAECLWVDDEAAMQLGGVVTGKRYARAAVLNATSEDTAKYFLIRANGRLTKRDPSWSKRPLRVVYPGAEAYGGPLLQAVQDAFADQWMLPRDGDRIRTFVDGNQPVVALIFTLHPVTGEFVDELYTLEQELDGICPVVLSGLDMGSEPPVPILQPQTITYIRPELPAGREATVLEDIRTIKAAPRR
jgi:hypothetical protein